MKNIILNTDIALDLLLSREYSSAAHSLLEKAGERGVGVWLSASSLPLLLHMVETKLQVEGESSPREKAKNKLHTLQQQLQILSCPGFACDGIFRLENPQQELLVRCADRLGESCFVVTRDVFFKGAMVLQLQKAIERLEKPQQESGSFPFIDLQLQQHLMLDEVERGFHEVLRDNRYIMGPKVALLEEKLRKYVDVKHAISCSSGTDALLMGLMAYGVGPGDAVFTPPFTFFATAEVISLVGATPVFVDIDKKTFNIDPAALQNAIDSVKERGEWRARGIIAVDLFGLPADYEKIEGIAKKNDLFLIEDMAQSFGASCLGRNAGQFGDLAATSFFPAKPLGCYGDGGAVFTDDDELAEKMISIRIHGQSDNKYNNVRIGINGRLDALQAVVLLAKLTLFEDELKQRQNVAKMYSKALVEHVTPPYIPDGYTSAWAQYSVLSDYREQCMEALQKEKIPTAIYYPIPLHLQTAFSFLGYREGDFPVSEAIGKRIFSIPMHPYLTTRQIEKIATIIRTATEKAKQKS